MIFKLLEGMYLRCNIIWGSTCRVEKSDTLLMCRERKGIIISKSSLLFSTWLEVNILTCCSNALSPKSETFKFPKESRRTFSGYTIIEEKKKLVRIKDGIMKSVLFKDVESKHSTFRSLWYTPLLWQWATASISCWKYRLHSFSGSLPQWT